MTDRVIDTDGKFGGARKGLALAEGRIERLEREIAEMRLTHAASAAFGIDKVVYSPPRAIVEYSNPFTSGFQNYY